MSNIIHYCWFGGAKKSKLIEKCMASWKKFCPDYEIIEWNESNFDVNCCDYVREAYEAQKWAFVSDYCRFWVLYNQGGVYLDTDVELLQSLDNLSDNCVGFEKEGLLNSGLVRSAQKGDMVCELMLKSYHESHFKKENGELNLYTVCERETDLLEQHGLKLDNTLQVVCGTTIYPTEYFQPMDLNTGRIHRTKKTVSIHHYAASWTTPYERFRGKIYRFIRRCFGDKIAESIRKVVGKTK